MNRRSFIQSLVAVLSLPAAPSLSLGSATAAVPAAATAVPTQARFWAIYMSALHGECTPQALQAMVNIPAVDAKKYIAQMVADGAIKPNPLFKKTVSHIAKPREDSLLDGVKKRLNMKARADADVLELVETSNDFDDLDDEVELLDEFTETESDGENEDEVVMSDDVEMTLPHETDIRS